MAGGIASAVRSMIKTAPSIAAAAVDTDLLEPNPKDAPFLEELETWEKDNRIRSSQR